MSEVTKGRQTRAFASGPLSRSPDVLARRLAIRHRSDRVYAPWHIVRLRSIFGSSTICGAKTKSGASIDRATVRLIAYSSSPALFPPFLGLENSPLKSSLSNSLSTCRLTSPSPFPRRRLMNVWKPERSAVLTLAKTDLEASALATKGCCDVDSKSRS